MVDNVGVLLSLLSSLNTECSCGGKLTDTDSSVFGFFESFTQECCFSTLQFLYFCIFFSFSALCGRHPQDTVQINICCAMLNCARFSAFLARIKFYRAH